MAPRRVNERLAPLLLAALRLAALRLSALCLAAFLRGALPECIELRFEPLLELG